MTSEMPVVLVTGAGRGLGRAIASVFHDNGYHVVATDCSAGLLTHLDGEERFTTSVLDVSSDRAAEDVAAMIASDIGRLDVIVNNAGVNSFYPVCEAPTQLTVDAFQINTFGALRTVRACLGMLIESKGCVVNISSESAPLRTPFQSYASSKMALEALSDVIRRELLPRNVHVALVRPGAIQTDMFGELANLENAVDNSRFDGDFALYKKGVKKRVPKNPSLPADVAAIVYKAATDPKKKPLYKINNNFALAVLSRMPTKMLDKILVGKRFG